MLKYGCSDRWSGCDVSIVTYYYPYNVFLVPLSTGVFSELKMTTSLFVENAEQFESHSFPIERKLTLFKFGYSWACVYVDGNIGRGTCP